MNSTLVMEPAAPQTYEQVSYSDHPYSEGLVEITHEKSMVCSRDPKIEQVVVGILVDAHQRDAFLSDRESYLAPYHLPEGAKYILLQLPTEQVLAAATEYQSSLPEMKPSDPCGRSTFGDFFCDS